MNNEGNNGNDFNPVSLGEIGNIEPVAPIESIDTLDDSSTNVPEYVDNNGYDIPEPINVNPTPNFDSIGTVPPVVESHDTPNNNAPKKKTNKTIILMIVVLVIAAVGVGVYIMLNMANRKTAPTVTLKDVKIEVNSEVSTLISDYANNATNCSLDVTAIKDTSKVGTVSEFIVTCNGVEYKGKATIVDSKAPVVEVNDVTVAINGEVKPEDFIKSCDDATECTYKFKEEDKVIENLKVAGEYQTTIIVSDEANNSTEVTAKLIVKDGPVAVMTLKCSKRNDNYKLIYTLGFSADGNLIDEATKSYEFSFDEAAYKKLKEESGNVDTITYSNISGKPDFNDDNKTLTISVDISNINTEMKTTLSKSYQEVRAYFVRQGYSCI